MKKKGAYRVCERCGREKPLDDFVGRLYPERGPGVLCRTCLRKKPLTNKDKKKKAEHKATLAAKRRRKAKISNARYYRKTQLESEMFKDIQYSNGIRWHCNVSDNSRLWREYIANGGVPLDTAEWHEYKKLGGRYLGFLPPKVDAMAIANRLAAKLKAN